jgi:hypothetical protein
MRQSQRGVTMIGWLILLIPVGIVFYACIRLAPVYLNYMRMSQSIAQTAQELKGEDSGPSGAASFRAALDKRFEIEGIDHPTAKEIDVHRDGDHWVAIADYEDQAPLFANVSILVVFHKEVAMR